MKILDLGCGKNKYKSKDPSDEVIGVDSVKEGTQADIVHDLNTFPYPFDNDEFDLIICSHVLEHLRDIPIVIDELWRISKNGARIIIRTPSFNSADSYRDPTHIHHFTLNSFDYWDENLGEGFKHYTARKTRFNITTKKLQFGKFQTLIGISLFANRYYDIYKRFFCWSFPAREVSVEMITKKSEIEKTEVSV